VSLFYGGSALARHTEQVVQRDSWWTLVEGALSSMPESEERQYMNTRLEVDRCQDLLNRNELPLARIQESGR
jgi:hypothetical protein